MSTQAETDFALHRRARLHFGDVALRGIAGAAALAVLVVLAMIAYKVTDEAWASISTFGLGFLTSSEWNAVTNTFGARDLIWGTAVTSFFALLIAVPISIAIGLFLSELAPRRLRGPVGALVELLAAIPSVVLGLWGILIMGPFLEAHVEPFLNDHLGWIPLFSGSPSNVGLLPACLVLTIMIVPIVASISRELFEGVPSDLKAGALALGSTRWEMVRGVAIPQVSAGLAAAVILGLARALGEAIAVSLTIGGTARTGWSLFGSADTLASRIANQYQGAATSLQTSSIAYAATILLVFSLVANLSAALIVRRIRRRTGAR
ncbi:MAG TPA: phosphate ABC transporter permease subunit PstC [Solirubrobacteraceae bacterium]|nr:phosphate ABC transporter permease subunit PstC [Solirubrobacteraceae bacterium]